mmetsp:Transcript_15588/g.36913  ORF Transcript_15588/g.36913 Transcript_15588/m.36913 type:complete len:468 (-) Transcript_15588:760-2163(-)
MLRRSLQFQLHHSARRRQQRAASARFRRHRSATQEDLRHLLSRLQMHAQTPAPGHLGLNGQVEVAVLQLHLQLCLLPVGLVQDLLPAGLSGVDLQSQARPIHVLHPLWHLVGEDQHGARADPHGLTLPGLSGRDGLGPLSDAAVPAVLPMPRGDPHLATGDVAAAVPDRCHEDVLQEDVLLVGGTLRVLGPEEIPARHQGKSRLGGLLTSGEQHGQHLVPHAQVGGDHLERVVVIAPGPVVRAMEPQDGAEDAVGRPAHQIPGALATVAPAVRVHEGFQPVQACVHHGLRGRLEVHPVARPPHGEAVLRGVLCSLLGIHAGLPVRLSELGQSHRPAVEGVPGLVPDVAVVVLHRAVINVGAPGGIVQTLPHAIRRGLVHEGRRDGKLPVVVKPPVGHALGHPLAEPLPSELGLLGGGLQTPRVAAGHWVGVVVEVGPQPPGTEVLEPLREVGKESGVRMVIVPVLIV